MWGKKKKKKGCIPANRSGVEYAFLANVWYTMTLVFLEFFETRKEDFVALKKFKESYVVLNNDKGALPGILRPPSGSKFSRRIGKSYPR